MSFNKEKENTIAKSFRFRSEQLDYTIKLRKYNWWWLLLLLLLLLLIPLHKDVFIKTINAENQSAISNAEVTFHYKKNFVYESGRFFTNDAIKLISNTDANGVASFLRLKYSVYSLLFKHNTKALIYATSGCFVSDTLTPKYHTITNKDTIVLKLTPVLVSLDFKVIDKEDSQPLTDAMVTIVAGFSGKEYLDTAKSGPDGRVVFNNIPKCGKILNVMATSDGYLPDSIINKTTEDLSGDIDTKRLLKLSPIKGVFSCFVVDCKTGRPIVDAKVTIEIDYSGKKAEKTKFTKTTNVNGKAKGFSEDYIIAKIHLTANASYYEQGELPGWHLVRDFIDLNKYPDDKRTIKICPIENPVEFKNIDSLTQKPLSGVKNIVTITNTGIIKTDTVFSDRNGVFVIGINPEDIVSIIAQYPPDYEDNNSTIKEADGIQLKNGSALSRTIPLKPKMVELIFRTIDAEDKSLPISDADVKITVDGSHISPPDKSDSNGEFKITVPVYSNISIEASKTDYGTNDTTIKNTSVKQIMPPAMQSSRDIPLKNIPKPICVTFRDVDAEDRSLLSGVTNEIYVDGVLTDTITGGAFEVCALPGQKIKIKASNGFDTNETSVDGSKTIEELEKAPSTERDIPLKKQIGPRKNCRVHFTGLVMGGTYIDEHISVIYQEDSYSELVGDGDYPDNNVAFPNAVAHSFDGIAIDNGTHLILYSGKNFNGKVLLDISGPAIINNVLWINDNRYNHCNFDLFPEPLQSNFPKSVRKWSSENMHTWSQGSCKIFCD